MVRKGETKCPGCGNQLIFYDRVKRIVRTKSGMANRTYLRRFRCQSCGTYHRELPEFIFPNKQYEAEIIIGVIEKLITCDTLGFEDYPCEATMIRWAHDKCISYYGSNS